MTTQFWKSVALWVPIAVLFSAFTALPGGNTSKVKLKFADDDQSIFWQISGNGLKRPSFLYGTIHIQDKRVFMFDDQVTDAFDACDAYAMELLMDDINPVAMAGMTFMKDTTLDMLLTDAELAELDSVMKAKMGMGVKMFNNMKPFFISAQLSTSGVKSDMPLPLDLHLDKMAKEDEKKRLGIEEFEDQIGVINKIPLKEQAEMLMEGLKDTAGDAMMEEMIEKYLKGDINSMLDMGNEEELPDNFMDDFLDGRNVKMAETISQFINEQTTFCAIGSAHLGGERGVVNLLRKKGYTLRAVDITFKKP